MRVRVAVLAKPHQVIHAALTSDQARSQAAECQTRGQRLHLVCKDTQAVRDYAKSELPLGVATELAAHQTLTLLLPNNTGGMAHSLGCCYLSILCSVLFNAQAVCYLVGHPQANTVQLQHLHKSHRHGRHDPYHPHMSWTAKGHETWVYIR